MRLKRPLRPARLPEPQSPQQAHRALIPRIHIRQHLLDPSIPEHAPGAQKRTQGFGHVALFPIAAVEHEANFEVGSGPDAGFADDFVVVVVVIGGKWVVV